MPISPSSAQVVVVADDPIEAGMLALDLVQAGVAAQAVRDPGSAVSQLAEIRSQRSGNLVVVAAFRELSQTVQLWQALLDQAAAAPAFVAVVMRGQREEASQHMAQLGWAGVAVRPVNATELVGVVVAAAAPVAGDLASHETRTGSLEDETLVDLLGSLVERIPRPGAGKTAILTMNSGGRSGVVALVHGDLVHAEIDGEPGRHSLERMAAWRRGTFRLDAMPWQGPHSLQGAAVSMLAIASEYARRIEEARQSLPYIDCVCTVRWERVRPLPVVAEAMFRRIASGQVLAEAIRGDGDDELEAFAALETRIRRGAVVPQVETSPQAAAQPHAEPTRTPGGVSPTPALNTIAPTRAGSSGWSAVPMTLVDAPHMPERKRSHPTTHLYRIGPDGKAIPSIDPAEVAQALAGTPPGATSVNAPTEAMPSVGADGAPPLPSRGGQRRMPTPLQAGAALHVTPTGGHGGSAPPSFAQANAGGAANRAGTPDPQIPARRQPSSLLSAGKVDGRRITDLGAGGAAGSRRPFGNTGWFGVNSADSNVTEAEQPLDQRRPQSSVRIPDTNAERLVSGSAASARINNVIGRPLTPVDRVAARPYAWIPAAPMAEEEEPEPPPKAIALLKPRNWPWIIAGVGLLAMVIWVVAPRPPASGYADGATKQYLQAVALLDNGHTDQARAELVKLAKLPEPRAEIYLHLAIIDIEARRFDTARKALDTYLAHPKAMYAERARKLVGHVFGATDRQAKLGAPSP